MCEIYVNQNHGKYQQPLLSSLPPSPFLSSPFCFFPLLLFLHVTFIPVWVTAICVTWAHMSVGGFVAGRLSRRSGGLYLTQQLRMELEWGLWVHGLLGSQK